jgi:predicted nucleic acid-binding protein
MYLLDTNVISELRRRRPHGAVMAWLERVDDSDADSGDVAQAFRDDVARAYDMMSPRERSFAGG